MSKINKIRVDETTYDIEDLSVPSWAKQNTKPSYDYSEITNAPTKLSELQNDEGFISQELEPQFNASASKNITSQDITNWNNKSEFSGDYDDLTNKPSIPDSTSDLTNDSGFINNTVNNLTNYELKADTGHSIAMSIDSSTYVLTLSLKNSAGTILNTQTVDLPLESVVVDGEYDSTNKKIILELQSGSTIDIPVGDLINGLQSEITSSNKLNADLVDDTNTTNKFVSASDKTTWNNKYDKPIAGIPSTDLSSAVQTSLGKADTALQTHQDISGKEDTTNKTTTIDAQSTNTQYPSAKAVYDLISAMGGGDFEFASYTATDSSPFVFAGKKGFYYYSGSSSISYFYYKMDDTSTVKQLYNNLPVYMIIFKDISKDTVAYDETIGYVFFKYARSSYDIIGYQELKYRSTTVALTEYIGNQYQIISSYNQTFYGTKTFGSFPITPSSAPTTNYQTANKKYVDDQITAQIGNINTILATLTTPQGGNQ